MSLPSSPNSVPNGDCLGEVFKGLTYPEWNASFRRLKTFSFKARHPFVFLPHSVLSTEQNEDRSPSIPPVTPGPTLERGDGGREETWTCTLRSNTPTWDSRYSVRPRQLWSGENYGGLGLERVETGVEPRSHLPLLVVPTRPVLRVGPAKEP